MATDRGKEGWKMGEGRDGGTTGAFCQGLQLQKIEILLIE